MSTCYVYTALDAARRPLYVGMTNDPKARMSAHRTSPWHPLMDALQVDAYPTREEAAEAEARTIRELQPIYNVNLRKELPRRPRKNPPRVSLRSLRRSLQYTPQQVAERAGMTVADYRAIEAGHAEATSADVAAIAGAFGLQAEDFMRTDS